MFSNSQGAAVEVPGDAGEQGYGILSRLTAVVTLPRKGA